MGKVIILTDNNGLVPPRCGPHCFATYYLNEMESARMAGPSNSLKGEVDENQGKVCTSVPQIQLQRNLPSSFSTMFLCLILHVTSLFPIVFYPNEGLGETQIQSFQKVLEACHFFLLQISL